MRHRIANMLRRLAGRVNEGQWWYHVDRTADEPPWHTNYNTGQPCDCGNSRPVHTHQEADHG